MPPDAFMFDTSGQLVMQTAIGGAGTLFGPLVGATVWLYLSDFFQNALHLGATWKLVLGIVFVLLVCFLRRGIVGGIVDLYALRGRRRREAEPESRRDARTVADFAAAGQVAATMPPRQRAGDRDRRPDPAGDRPDQALRRRRRQQRHRLHRQSRRTARHHRPERRRQDHILQDADLRGAADARARSCSRAATSPA